MKKKIHNNFIDYFYKTKRKQKIDGMDMVITFGLSAQHEFHIIIIWYWDNCCRIQ